MGKQLPKQDGKLTETERAIEQREKPGHTRTTDTERGRGTGRGTGTAAISANQVPKLVMVDVPGDSEPSEPAPKRRGRPPGSKKTAASKPASKAATKANPVQVEMILATVNGIMATRPGMEVWILSPDEIKQLSEPIANLMAKSEALATATAEHADALALLTACLVIFVPKFIMYQATKPKKPKKGENVNYGKQQAAEPTNAKREDSSRSRSHDRQPTNDRKTNGKEFGGSIHQLIPANAGF